MIQSLPLRFDPSFTPVPQHMYVSSPRITEYESTGVKAVSRARGQLNRDNEKSLSGMGLIREG